MSESFATGIEWAIVEVKGHTTFAGRVSEVELAGAGVLRVDIPAVGPRQACTKYIGTSSVHILTVVDEETARRAVDTICDEPVSVWQLSRVDAPDEDEETPWQEQDIPY